MTSDRVVRALSTAEGRRALARAMVQPIRGRRYKCFDCGRAKDGLGVCDGGALPGECWRPEGSLWIAGEAACL